MNNKDSLGTIIAVVLLSSLLPITFSSLGITPEVFMATYTLLFMTISHLTSKRIWGNKEKLGWRILKYLLWLVRLSVIATATLYISIAAFILEELNPLPHIYSSGYHILYLVLFLIGGGVIISLVSFIAFRITYSKRT